MHIFLMKKTNACLKNNELTAVLGTHFKGKVNLVGETNFHVRMLAVQGAGGHF